MRCFSKTISRRFFGRFACLESTDASAGAPDSRVDAQRDANASSATLPEQRPSARSYATGIANPVVDVCGTRVNDGLFTAAFD